MKITLLKGVDTFVATEAWRLSRDQNQQTSFEEIAGVDAPVLEMPCAVLHFTDMMIIEREIFTTLRSHVMWARTSRVDDPLQFTVPPEWHTLVDIDLIKLRMEANKAAGMPQDQWRALLPLVAHTSWTARHSLRDLVKLRLYFKYLGTKVPEPLRSRCWQLAGALQSLLVDLVGVTALHKLLDNIALDKFLCEDLALVKNRTEVGNSRTFTAAIPLMLRAQLVRHRPILFADNLFGLLINAALHTFDLQTPVQIECIANKDFWRAILTKRACWIAQWDLWAPVLQQLGNSGQALPCANNAPCPCVPDNHLRLAGKDPAPPCPIWLKRTANAFDKNTLMKYAAGRQQFWKEEIVTS